MDVVDLTVTRNKRSVNVEVVIDLTLPTKTSSDSYQINQEGNLCCVCLDEKKTWLNLPCKHVCCCKSCGEKLQKTGKSCFLCRTKIQKSFNIFY
jgi:hypothetical protein